MNIHDAGIHNIMVLSWYHACMHCRWSETTNTKHELLYIMSMSGMAWHGHRIYSVSRVVPLTYRTRRVCVCVCVCVEVLYCTTRPVSVFDNSIVISFLIIIHTHTPSLFTNVRKAREWGMSELVRHSCCFRSCFLVIVVTHRVCRVCVCVFVRCGVEETLADYAWSRWLYISLVYGRWGTPSD